jgi:hypothetical protein
MSVKSENVREISQINDLFCSVENFKDDCERLQGPLCISGPFPGAFHGENKRRRLM